MAIRVCVAGATGWAGAAVVRHILSDMASTDDEFALSGAVARQKAGSDIGEALGLPHVAIRIARTVDGALQAPTDVLIDYTHPAVVKGHRSTALDRGVRVVIGTSGLTESDYDEIDFEAVFGLPDERLTLRHDAGAGAGPYVAGTLLAAREVMRTVGLVRGLDRLMFEI